jgi:AcrR family transcriptional regulator
VSSATQRQAPARRAPPRRRRMAAQDRRALILDASREAFAEGGYHSTSLEDVAERAGVSKALLYEHFDSKRDLHAAMLEAHVRDLLERIGAALTDAEPGEERLRAGLEAFFSYLEERRGAAAILLRNTGDPDVLDWLNRFRDGVAAAIITLMTEEVRELFGDPEELKRTVEMIAQQLIGAIQGLTDWWSEHREVPREAVIATAMDFAWVGLDRISRGERWAVT